GSRRTAVPSSTTGRGSKSGCIAVILNAGGFPMSRWMPFALATVLIASCNRPAPPSPSPSPLAESAVPHYQGLGDHKRKVTTASPEAQQYFDQGLAFLFAFNHDEAIRSFQRAADIDPSCAMADWAIALA